MVRASAFIVSVTVVLAALALPNSAQASVPYCSGISQPDIPTANQTPDGKAVFSWPSVYSGAEYKYSFTGYTGSAWTPWTNFASAGGSTSVVIPFEVSGVPVVRLSFVVIAQCWAYESGNIEPKGQATIDYTPPASPPSQPQVTLGKDSALITVVPSAANGRERITEYRVITEPGGQECVVDGANPNKTCTITNLMPGTAYSFIAYARNSLGTSSPSASSQRLHIPTVPGSPQNVRAEVAKGRGSVVWMPPESNGYSPINRYIVISNPGQLMCETSGALSCQVKGLSNGTSYTFRVTAFNAAGQSLDSAPSTQVKLLVVPSQPVQVKTTRDGSSIKINWNKPKSDGGSAIRKYIVTASPSGKTCQTKGLTCTVSGLQGGENYFFAVQALNRSGLSPSSRSGSILIPVPPKSKPSIS